MKREDDAMRAELCPSGYQFTEYSPGRCGGDDIGVLYKDFLKSVKLDQVKKSRLKYIEWLIPIYIPLVS